MALTEADAKKIALVILFAGLAVLAFLVIKPVLLSVLAGLILAYIFLPVYKLILKVVKSKTISAAIVSILLLAMIIIPLWYLLPMMSEQVFGIFKLSQNLDLTGFTKAVFPSASDQFVAQVDATIKNSFSKITSSILNSLVDFLLNFATISLHLLLVAFVFFFSLKDADKLKNFASGLLPLGKTKEKHFVKQFKDITQSILYGQIIAGVIQGTLAALALFTFNIPNALILSIISMILSIIPVIGPGFVYVPVTIFLIITGDPLLATGYFLFNVIIVSSLDNIFRAHFVSKRTNLSQAIILIGMIGGLYLFNVLGLIIGPLILAYFITFLRAYKEKSISTFFD
ncbi:MAG: AI-2E family transporter [Nanoarchaeota archaeon]|nr:AI-2E family transporter [Nanoarchaeota archaeon]MBU0976956.1 AI-2E family transporter [Nanoarchaeota archaeon]